MFTLCPCRAVAVPPFHSQRCFIALTALRATIELSIRVREVLLDITRGITPLRNQCMLLGGYI